MDLFSNFLELTLFGSFLWFAITLTVLFILFFVSEAEEKVSIALVSFAIFVGLTAWKGNIAWQELFSVTGIVIYLILGLIHTSIRFFFFGRRNGKKIKEKRQEWRERYKIKGDFSEEEETKFQESSLYGAKDIKSEALLQDHAFRWWILFPISILYWMFHDFMFDAWNWIWKYTKEVFYAIYRYGEKTA